MRKILDIILLIFRGFIMFFLWPFIDYEAEEKWEEMQIEGK